MKAIHLDIRELLEERPAHTDSWSECENMVIEIAAKAKGTSAQTHPSDIVCGLPPCDLWISTPSVADAIS
jgi:hypothetical protein